MRLLIGMDGSATAWHALEESMRLLPLGQSDVTVATVAPLIAVVDDPLAYGGPHPGIYRDMREAAQRDLDAALAALKSAGIEAQGVLREGDPAAELLSLAEELKPDLIIVGSHGRGPLGRLFLGSVSDALVHRHGGAVFVVRHPQDVFATDGEAPVLGYMQPQPLCVTTETPVSEVARLMRDRQIGFLPVLSEGRLVGVLTDRDLVLRVLAEPREGVSPQAGDVCSREPVWVTPRMPIEEAARLMTQHHVRRVVVMDGTAVVGVLSLDDMARQLAPAAVHTLNRLAQPSPLGR
ncbi:MAG: CBS domain-containing protein [Candidatus Sericytochromatia bacterium]|nr:CBS domain-containing protein [Candidatus Sericytochromatia bacterium]